MAQFIHSSVKEATERGEPRVTLAVVPVEGSDELVKDEIDARGGRFETAAFRMLEVELPVDELEEFAELDEIQSIEVDDAEMEPLESGNLNSLLE